MKMLVSDDVTHDRKIVTFHLDYQEMVEYSLGIPHSSFKHGSHAIADMLLLLIRIFTAEAERKGHAGLRVQVSEMRPPLRTIQEHIEDEQASSLPGLLAPGEEGVIDAEFTDEPWDETEGET
jgi:hypothetical protein